jgi:hypothetical protein
LSVSKWISDDEESNISIGFYIFFNSKIRGAISKLSLLPYVPKNYDKEEQGTTIHIKLKIKYI